jgi:Uma2 family endonuclease
VSKDNERIAPLPRGEDLPYSDGDKMESEQHVLQMTLLIETLQLGWADRQDFFVGGDMFIYFSALQAKKNDFRGPDVFVVMDTHRLPLRNSWVMWEEDNKLPTCIIELLSPSTEQVDRGEKMRIYERVMRVPLYFLFHPWTGAFEGYELVGDRYRPIAPAASGRLPAAQLGLELGLWEGAHHGAEAQWLRWFTPAGAVLPTGEEMAAAAIAHAKSEKARAEEAKARADEERARADELARRLAEYERRFGKLP